MEVHIYSVKAKNQAGNLGVKYIRTTQKGQSLIKNQIGILGILSKEFMHFAGNPKMFIIFPLKVATTLLSGSGKGTVGT